jgi:hypothetical protein
LSLLHSVKTGSGAHPVSYSMGWGFIPRGGGGVKRPGRVTDRSPSTSAKVKMVELYLHSSMSSWHSA